MSNDSLDFLDETTPAAPSVTVTEPNIPATSASTTVEKAAEAAAPIEPEQTPEDRVKAAQAVVEAADANARDAKALLHAAIKDTQKAEIEIPLHVRNAEAKAIDQANRDRHEEALAKVAAAGVDVNRLIQDLGRPRPRKNPPVLFKP